MSKSIIISLFDENKLKDIVLKTLTNKNVVSLIVRNTLEPASDQGELSTASQKFNSDFKSTYTILSGIRGEDCTDNVFLFTRDIDEIYQYESEEKSSENFEKLYTYLKKDGFLIEDAYPYIFFKKELKCELDIPEQDILEITNQILQKIGLTQPNNGFYLENYEFNNFQQKLKNEIPFLKLDKFLKLNKEANQFVLEVENSIEIQLDLNID
ncbi:hypothetical protein [uncultured Flavobacterium sp.]|uniref:hypothetical protein n=1 Tax=uncultured Flavobacterium sp. TaxID=165435 RepID=UPI00259392F9|nr:hypothetical protein [uncultured Flavobacterium sp.]